MDIKPINAPSAALIEPDDEHEHGAKRQKVASSPDSIVSALLSLKKLPLAKLRPLRHPRNYSSLPAHVPWQALINHENRIENDHNHISDDEDDDECKVLTMMALSKPWLPSRIARANDSCISISSPVAFTSSTPSRKRKSAHSSPAPFFLPVGRPLAAAPCFPSLVPGESLSTGTICQLIL
jgi:hypothetical protein